jgi:thiaminase
MLFKEPITKKIFDQAKHTSFIQEMTAGNFSPMKYSHFKQQDTVYLKTVANIFASGVYSNEDLAKFCTNQAKKFGKLFEVCLLNVNFVHTIQKT